MIYQINSSSDARETSNKMKKGLDEITNAMRNARDIAHKKKVESDELKINLYEKKDKMKKTQQELIRATKRVESAVEKTLELESEVNKIKLSIEKIQEAIQDIDPKYFEQSQSDLVNLLTKSTADFEKAQSDLNAARKAETNVSKKLQDIESDLMDLEVNTFDKINEAERMISNVTITIEHIIRSYDEITIVSKDLLKSAIATNTKFEDISEQNTEQSQPQQEFSEAKIII